jgi:hypothetical protein
MTTTQLKARRKVIVKRVAARKIKETWRMKRARGEVSERSLVDDFGGVPDTDAALDELPKSLVG